MDIGNLTISRIHNGLLKKEFSARELAKAFLERIEDIDKKIKAFLTVSDELAMREAERVDEMISRGEKVSLLAGVPYAVKDAILVKDLKCTAGSKILGNYIAPYDATVIRRLRKEGAIILGKTNLDEFAMGSSTENSAFFPTRNPHDLERVPGGSSGGSAAAVAAGLSVFALGSDTGGSVRQPASFCGVVGLKPTYGAVSRYGLIAFASSLDQIGPLAKNVEDTRIVFQAISGRDDMDSTSLERKEEKKRIKIKEVRIGVPKEYFIKGISPGVEKLIKNAIKKYEDMGAKIEEISLPHTDYALSCYYIIAPSEASANLARYDGIRYGFSEKGTADLLETYLRTREKGFGPEVKRRIMIGTYTLSAGYYEAYYLRAQKVRRLIKRDFEEAFEKVDFIFTPVAPTPAFKIGEKVDDPLKMYLSDVFTVPVSLAGLPSVSIPSGQDNGLPVGLQIIGRHFAEESIFELAGLL